MSQLQTVIWTPQPQYVPDCYGWTSSMFGWPIHTKWIIICTGKWSMCHTFSISHPIPPAAGFWPQHLAITKHANGIWRVHPSKGSHLGSYLGRYKHACIDSMHTVAVLHDVPHRAFYPKQLVSGPNFWRPPGCENGTWWLRPSKLCCWCLHLGRCKRECIDSMRIVSAISKSVLRADDPLPPGHGDG